MAGSLNKVLLIGRLGADPEIKQMVNGKNVARLSLATSQSWKDKNTGEKKEKTEWHRVVVFNCSGAGSSETPAVEANFGNPTFSISSGNADANGYGNFEYAPPSGYYSLCTKNLAQYG